MRAIKRISIVINKEKQTMLNAIAIAYANEKQYWLSVFQQKANLAYIKKHRIIRDQAIKSQYQSVNGLQARMWKLALQDAADTMDKYWKSTFEKVRKDIYLSMLTDEQKHYAFWLLKNYNYFAQIQMLKVPAFKSMAYSARKAITRYLNKKIKLYSIKLPQVKTARSFVLDSNCYEIFTRLGRQYIKIMSLIPRRRLVIPLLGETVIKGNVRVIISGNLIEVHYASEVKCKPCVGDKIIAVDFGYTEVITDHENDRYGLRFGQQLSASSDKLNVKMRRRNKLHALHKKYQASDLFKQRKKAKRIQKYNLGRIKLVAEQERIQSTLGNEINQAFNELSEKKVSIVISENLSCAFTFNRGPVWNRRLSAWVKGMLKERLEFKALAKGFSHQQVNPAYTSQTCLSCKYVDAKNRKGNLFRCRHCGYVGDADWVAAMNLYSRYFDREITRYTPYRDVKRILLERFHRHLESNSSGTVSGRIRDTAAA